MGNIQGIFADQDSITLTGQVQTANNNQTALNAALAEANQVQGTNAVIASGGLLNQGDAPVPTVGVTLLGTIGAALGGIGQTGTPSEQPGGGGIPCFSFDTPITLFHDVKPIGEVLVGQDRAMCEDPCGNRLDSLVIGRWEHWVEESLMVTFADGRKTHTHPAHKYRTELGVYVPIGLLDSVWHQDNGWHKIDIVEKVALFTPMLQYNLHIDLYHNYEANGDGVSNLKPLEPPDEPF